MGSRSPSIAKSNTTRASSSGFTVLLPTDLSVSHAASKAVSAHLAPSYVAETIRAHFPTLGFSDQSPVIAVTAASTNCCGVKPASTAKQYRNALRALQGALYFVVQLRQGF
jgi:hypothetical protein